MSDNQGPVINISGKAKDAGYGEFYAIDSFDLEWIKKELGTSVVSFTIFRSKEPKGDSTHYMKIQPSDPKYLKRNYKEKYQEGSDQDSSGEIRV